MWTTLRSEWIVNLLYVAATLTCLATGAPCLYFGKETCHYASPFLVTSCSLLVFSLKCKQASFNLKKIFYNSQCLSLFSHDMGNLINVLRKRKHTTLHSFQLYKFQNVHLMFMNGHCCTSAVGAWTVSELPSHMPVGNNCRSTYSISIDI